MSRTIPTISRIPEGMSMSGARSRWNFMVSKSSATRRPSAFSPGQYCLAIVSFTIATRAAPAASRSENGRPAASSIPITAK
jgi:hypothetical protein